MSSEGIEPIYVYCRQALFAFRPAAARRDGFSRTKELSI